MLSAEIPFAYVLYKNLNLAMVDLYAPSKLKMVVYFRDIFL